jgi:hypothetical protein
MLIFTACANHKGSNQTQGAKQIAQHVLTDDTPAQKVISQDAALDIAKKLEPKSDIKWETKMIVTIDAETGATISVAEIEAD